MATGRAAATDEARLSEFFQAVGLDADDDTLAGLLKGLSVNQPQWSLRRVSPQLSCVWPAFRAEADCQALHVAAASGRVNSVTSLLRRDAQWGARTRRGVTPLLLAAAGGHAAVVALLIDEARGAFALDESMSTWLDATPLGPDNQPGPTPLYAAARLRTEADLRNASSMGGLPAAAFEELAVLEAVKKAKTVVALLAAGADPNRRSYRQRTALHAAAMASAGPTREFSLRIIASLLRAGAWTQARDLDGLTPLALAARERSRGRMLHGEGDASAPHNAFFTAVARELRWTPAVRLLWLGQRSGGDSVLAKLDRDTLLLVCRFAVEGDGEPDQEVVAAEIRYTADVVEQMERFQLEQMELALAAVAGD